MLWARVKLPMEARRLAAFQHSGTQADGQWVELLSAQFSSPLWLTGQGIQRNHTLRSEATQGTKETELPFTR